MKRAITGGALLGVLALGSAGVVALPLLDRGHGLAAAATPIGSTADQRATAPVARRDLVDRLTQAGTLGYGDRTPLRGAAAGMVTAAPPVGTVLGRGDVAYAIDGRPVYVLTGSVPFWRDLAPGAEGDDVAQLEANLVALGYATDEQLKGDGRYDAATVRAVKAWRKDIGDEQTGNFARAWVVVLADAARVAARNVEPGATVGPGQAVLDVTGTARVVTIKLDASRQSLVKAGDSVQVEIPGSGTTIGTIREVGRVATDDGAGGPSGSAKLTVVVTLDDANAGAHLEQAPVTVKLTRSAARNVLAVPVQALLALAEGGFAVEVVDASGTHLTRVELGAFADGQVEVRGDVREGDTVVVAK